MQEPAQFISLCLLSNMRRETGSDHGFQNNKKIQSLHLTDLDQCLPFVFILLLTGMRYAQQVGRRAGSHLVKRNTKLTLARVFYNNSSLLRFPKYNTKLRPELRAGVRWTLHTHHINIQILVIRSICFPDPALNSSDPSCAIDSPAV